MKLSKREPKHMGEVMSDIAERYNKLTKTKMSKEKTINDLVGEMMTTKMNELPPKAVEYVKKLSNKIGFCGETCVTAYFDYCQLELGMVTDDEQYVIDDQRKLWYN